MGKTDFGVGSITCDRADLFCRSLSGIAYELKKRGHNTTVAVADDSSSLETRNIKREISAKTAEETGVKVRCLGLEEKLSFLEKLQQVLPGHLHDTARFFLFGDNELSFIKGAGGNRNALLSAFAGKSFASFDDDTELRTFKFRNSDDERRVERGEPGLNIGVYPDIESIEEKIELFTDDPFTSIDSLLGTEADQILSGSGRAKVRAVMLGIYGGRWFSRPSGILFNEGEARAAACASQEQYNKAKYNPVCYMQSPCIKLSDSSFFVSTAVGIDAESIVPPFFPQLRNEDNAWSILLGSCSSNSLIAHLPFAVYHAGGDKLPFTNEDFSKAGADLGLNILYILSALTDQLTSPGGGDPYEFFGNTLIGLSELSQKKWEDMCRGVWSQYVGDSVGKLKALLEKYDRKPVYWARDTEKYMDNLRSRSLEPGNFIPVELQVRGSVEEAGKLHRRILYNYGMLLTEWVKIWNAIARLNISGDGLLGSDFYLS